MAIPDISGVLQGFGFRHGKDSSFQIQRSASGNCIFIFGWDVETVRLWYSVFLAECLDITLYYVCICKESSVLGTGPSTGATAGTGAAPSEPLPAPTGGAAPAAGGATPTAPKPAVPDEKWIVTYLRKATEESCSFGSAKDLTNTDLQNLFNTKMGIQLPPPPTPATK